VPETPITPEQAAKVDRLLANYEDYLKRLSARLKQIGVRSPNCLPGWVEQARWSTGGLRHHFGEWASGSGPPKIPEQVFRPQ